MNNHNVIASLTSDTGRLNTVLSKIVSDGSGKSFRCPRRGPIVRISGIKMDKPVYKTLIIDQHEHIRQKINYQAKITNPDRIIPLIAMVSPDIPYVIERFTVERTFCQKQKYNYTSRSLKSSQRASSEIFSVYLLKCKCLKERSYQCHFQTKIVVKSLNILSRHRLRPFLAR